MNSVFPDHPSPVIIFVPMDTAPNLHNAQLFLDDTWVEETIFVSRQWHQPQRYPNPVLIADRPWEHWSVSAYGTVLHWGGKFRMWYDTWTRHTPRRICYAESDDGIVWEKPSLGLLDYEGSTANNIVIAGAGSQYIDDISVIDDPDDAQWPLKALFWASAHEPGAENYGYFAARSKDGIHWDRMRAPGSGPVLPQWGDRFNAVAAKLGGKYVVLGRYPDTWKRGGRCVWRTESADLLNWSQAKLVLARDAEDPVNMEYYSATAFSYESLTIGSIERMYMTPDRLDVELIWSVDHGHTWRRATRRPAFLSPAPGPRWDDTWVNLSSNAPIRRHNRLWFYYTGRSAAHNVPYPMNHGAIGLAVLRIDGFASLMAGERVGEVLTKPMRWPGGDLHVNADPRRDLSSHPGFCVGDIRVEARDAENKPVLGYTWDVCEPVAQTIDAPDACRKVEWSSGKSMQDLAGKDIRLAFRLRDAHLYSFRAK
jgi:hypothetical protein